MAQVRSRVIIIENHQVALIKRVTATGIYYLFPGGGVEEGGTVEEAAVREAWEELGVEVQLSDLVAIVEFGEEEHVFHFARIVGGVFGTGTDAELASLPTSPSGSYSPLWLQRDHLHQYDVRPLELSKMIQRDVLRVDATPLRIVEKPKSL